jgi:hypothetical protein
MLLKRRSYIEEALGIKGVYVTRALKKLEPHVITTLGKGNTRHRSLKKDRVTFEYIMYNFVIPELGVPEHMTEFLQSSYVQNLDIHGLEIDQLLVGSIANYLNNAMWMWKLFCNHPKLTDQLNTAIATDTPDNTAAKLLYRCMDVINDMMNNNIEIAKLLYELPRSYGRVISPDMRSDSSALPHMDHSELKSIMENDMEMILSEK